MNGIAAAGRMALWITLVILLLAIGLALAHGAPALVAKQGTVAPGGKVTFSGDALGKDGDTVTLLLLGVTYQARLGTATLKDDSFDNATFTIPRDAPPGTYIIRAKNGQINATAQLEITAPAPAAAPSKGASPPAPAPRAPTSGGEQGHSAAMAQAGQTTVVPEARSPVDRAVSVAVVVLTAAAAIVLLWRNRSDLTRIDR
jgi:hypothetical protein